MSLNGIDEIERALTMLSKANARTFMKIWASIPSGDRSEMLAYLTPMIVDLVQSGHEDAVALGLAQLNMQRAGIDLPTATADPPKQDEIAESLRFLLTARGLDVLRESVWDMVDRKILAGHRDTIMFSAFAAGNGYARKPEPGACSFCLMLASRGAVYRTARSAEQVGAPGVVMRGNAKRGDKFHDNCRCHAVEVSEGSGLPPEAVELTKLWDKTFYDGERPKLSVIDFESTNSLWKEAVKDFRV